jgi:3-oxosteroid 1-dehydrogenase
MSRPFFSSPRNHTIPSTSPKPLLKIATELGHIEAQLASEENCDILIVGSGAAGLVAALRAHSHGFKPLIIEKSSQIGGASSYSGGGVWVPNNYVAQAAGNQDSVADALTYLETIIGDVGTASSRERKMAFLTHGPDIVRFLGDLGSAGDPQMDIRIIIPRSPGEV